MSENNFLEAVELIKSGKKRQARPILKSLIEADKHDVAVWVWYAETFPTIQDKIKVMQICCRQNPGDELANQALESLKQRQYRASVAQSGATEGPVSLNLKPCPICGAMLQQNSSTCDFCGKATLTPRSKSETAEEPLPITRRRSTARFRIGPWVLITFLLITAFCVTIFWLVLQPVRNRNTLALGEQAKITNLKISIQPPVEFDFLTKSEVLDLRNDVVDQYADLILGDYRPSGAIFGQIVNGLPWWGMAGQFYYGSGDESIRGPAEESRFILNPFLLVAVEPRGMIDRDQISEAVILRPGFMFYCPPTNLQYWPDRAYGEVTYSAVCVRQMGYRYFDLIVYNARDMNLNYIFVSYDDSGNITNEDQPAEAYAIPQFIHQGGSCGYPGGCNNMSPSTPEIDTLEISGLPAYLLTWFWKEKPETLEQPVDMVFVVRFE